MCGELWLVQESFVSFIWHAGVEILDLIYGVLPALISNHSMDVVSAWFNYIDQIILGITILIPAINIISYKSVLPEDVSFILWNIRI